MACFSKSGIGNDVYFFRLMCNATTIVQYFFIDQVSLLLIAETVQGSDPEFRRSAPRRGLPHNDAAHCSAAGKKTVHLYLTTVMVPTFLYFESPG